MTTKYLVLVLLASACAMGADKPEWASNNGRSRHYPDAEYLTGFGFSQVTAASDKESALGLAGAFARKNLIEKVRVQIQSVTSQRTEEAGDKYSSMYASATQSTSALELEGLQTETYYDKGEEIQYALVYAKRDPIAALYAEKVKRLTQEIAAAKKEAEALEQHGTSSQALAAYAGCLPLCRQLEEARTVRSYLRLVATAAELQANADEDEASAAQIRQSIARLVRRPLKTVDDCAWYLAYVLKEQLEQHSDRSMTIMVAPLYYQDTKMGSSFSRYFKQVLEHQLIDVAKWDVVQQGAASRSPAADPARESAVSSGAGFVLSGSLWEQGTSVKFIVTVRSVEDGKILASAEAVTEAQVIASSGKSVKPENFQQALIDQKVFARDEVTGGGLTLEAWTNRGVENVMFTENDTLRIAVRVNAPCYIRFIYHTADGKRVLLLDNYFLDQSKVNTAYNLPEEFVCASPFGGETLQIFARTEKFDAIATDTVDGYAYLKDDLTQIVVGTRGFKKAAPKAMQTEQRIQITTMKE